MVKKAAFTLIELIFAIVIIAITVVSLPMMNQAISKGIDANLVQEAIFAAATQLNEVVTAHWDDNSLEPDKPNSFAKVIDVSNACDTNSSSSRYRLMPGHINESLHRRCLDSNATSLATANVTTVTSLEDMRGTKSVFINNTTDKKSGYKTDYNATISVTNTNVIFGTDQTNANPNMKKITVSIKDGGTLITTLYAYSANIGEVDYFNRVYY